MSGKRKKGFDKTVYHSFAMIMQFGINMLVPICALSALGIYIDKKAGTSFVMILLFFVGALAGARNVYRMAKYSMQSENADKRNENVKNAASHTKREETNPGAEQEASAGKNYGSAGRIREVQDGDNPSEKDQ